MTIEIAEQHTNNVTRPHTGMWVIIHSEHTHSPKYTLELSYKHLQWHMLTHKWCLLLSTQISTHTRSCSCMHSELYTHYLSFSNVDKMSSQPNKYTQAFTWIQPKAHIHTPTGWVTHTRTYTQNNSHRDKAIILGSKLTSTWIIGAPSVLHSQWRAGRMGGRARVAIIPISTTEDSQSAWHLQGDMRSRSKKMGESCLVLSFSLTQCFLKYSQPSIKIRRRNHNVS